MSNNARPNSSSGSGSGRSVPIRIKPEPVEEQQPMEIDGDSRIHADAVHSSNFARGSIPPSASASASVASASISHNNDDDDDEIVREIDVYISPTLATKLHLIQYPLTPAPSSLSVSRQQQPQQPPLPSGARIKPNHGILELDHPLPTSTFSSQRQLPEALNLSHRTFVGRTNTIAPVTHMALAAFDSASGTSMSIIPLSKVAQMRPGFQHVDALFENRDDDGAAADADSQHEEEGKRKKKKRENQNDNDNDDGDGDGDGDGDDNKQPVLLRKQESDRVAMARRSSYAYKKSSEDSEEWTSLAVCGPGTLERKEARRNVACVAKSTQLKFVHYSGGAAGAGAITQQHAHEGGERRNDYSAAYVRSLNYLPTRIGGTVHDVDDFNLPINDADADADGGAGAATTTTITRELQLLKDLTSKLVSILQKRGIPIPYAVLRTRFFSPSAAAASGSTDTDTNNNDTSISNDALLTSLSSVAYLIRGNFIIRSKLLNLSWQVEQMRDLILYLLNKYGFVQRFKLRRLCNSRNDNGSNNTNHDSTTTTTATTMTMVSEEEINAILEMIGRPCLNGWEMRVDDDNEFGIRFPHCAELHRLYWERRCRKDERFMELVRMYDEEEEEVEEEKE